MRLKGLEGMKARAKFDKQFGKLRVLLPVVHCISPRQVLTAIDAAMDNGADGLWFINQGGMSAREVLAEAAQAHRLGVPFVGVNLLGAGRFAAVTDASRYDDWIGGIWSDEAGISVRGGVYDARGCADVRDHMAQHNWGGLWFGGVAFKYQTPVPPEQWGNVARMAAPWVDVITTSGEGTGIAAPPEKLAAMREAIGDHPLAQAIHGA